MAVPYGYVYHKMYVLFKYRWNMNGYLQTFGSGDFFYFFTKYAPSFRTDLTDAVQRDFLPVLCDQIPSVTVYFPALQDFRAPCTAAFSQIFLKIRNAQTGMLQSPSAYILPDSVQFLPLFFRKFRLFLYISRCLCYGLFIPFQCGKGGKLCRPCLSGHAAVTTHSLIRIIP